MSRISDDWQSEPALLHGAKISGWIDLLAGAEGATSISESERSGLVSISGRNLSLTMDTSETRWLRSSDAITLISGHPRIDGASEFASTEQIHALLSAAETGAPARLGGRFSVIHVNCTKRSALLATDRFAVHPLCYAISGGRFAFSDRADCVPAVATEIDPQAIYDYVYFHVLPAPRTIFKGVERLESARALHVDPKGLRLQTLWRPHFAHDAEPRSSVTLQSVIEQAVRREAVNGSVGCFLSGGTDSSTVAGMLGRIAGRPARSFSIGFDANGYDEMAYARIAAQHFGCEHHEHYVTPGDLLAGIPGVASCFDQPFGNSSALPAYYCARLGAGAGIKKMLAGDGGDELFGGNTRYAKQKVFEAYNVLPAWVRTSLVQPGLLRSAWPRRVPLLKKAASYVAQATLPMPARMETYNLLQRFGREQVFAAPLLERVDADAPARLQADVYARTPGSALVDRMLAYDWRFTLADNDLPKVIGSTRLAGVQAGFPLLDDDVVDYSLTLTAGQKVRGVALRHQFKSELTGFLPNEVIRKKKHGFGLPVGPWLLREQKLHNFAAASLASLASRGIIRSQLVDSLFSERLGEHAAYYGEMIWVLMMLEQWLAARAPSCSFR